MHSNGIGCPKTVPLPRSSLLLVIASDIHLEPKSVERVKNVDFHTAYNVQKQATPLLYF